MIINHNMASLNTYGRLSANNTATSKSLEKLSSGLRINRAGDDAAGLAISEKMRGQIRGLDQATRNAQDATSMLNTAEGNLNEVHSILQRMKELATQAANDTNVGIDRGEIQKEINQLTSEINRVGNTTEFNTQKLLDGGGSQILTKGAITVTDGGVAGQIGSVQTVVTSATGKSMASFTANGYTVSIEANNTTNNLGGKTIKFVAGATAAGSESITDDGSGNITVKVHADSTLANIQTALDNSASFSGNGGVTLSITNTSTGAATASTAKLSGGVSPTDVQLAAATTTASSFSTGGGTVARGVYSFDVKDAFVKAGDTFKLKIANGASPDGWSEITLTASNTGAGNVSTGATAGTFEIGTAANRATAEQQAANIVAALKDNTAWDIDGSGKNIDQVYDISYNGSSVILTEKTALGPQASVKNGSFTTTTAVKGAYDYTHTSSDMVEVGGSFIIDGQEISVVDGASADDADKIAAGTAILRTSTAGSTAADQMTLLKDAVNRNAALNNKYSATDSSGTLTLTQKAGYASSSEPTIKTTTKAGQSFTATFQIGANMGQSMSIEINDMRAQAIQISGATAGGAASVAGAVFTATKTVTNGTDNTNVEFALDVSDHTKATAAIKVLDNAINKVSAERSKIGAYTNRLEHTINNLGTSSENLTAAESRIRDVDMAKEMMSYQKNNILSQAATAMLAQANQQPQGVLQLLR